MSNPKFGSKLWNEWVTICNKYLRAFCEKHGYDFDEATNSWVSNFDGTVVLCGDEYVTMEDIIIDIERNVPEEEFLKWYYYTIEVYPLMGCSPNYESWLNGCPRLTKEEINKKIEITQIPENEKITRLKKEMDDLIDEYLGERNIAKKEKDSEN